MQGSSHILLSEVGCFVRETERLADAFIGGSRHAYASYAFDVSTATLYA